MLTALDHIIIGVHDLPQATTRFHEKLGLVASGGGNHPTGGTANRIIVIGDTYLELITVREPAEAQHSMLTRLVQGDGYLNFVLASDNIAADSEAMRARGIPIVGPNAGALHSAERRSRSWVRTDVERPDLTQHYPFLIQHDSVGEERRFRLAGWQRPPEHPLGATHIISTTLAVQDIEEARQRFQHIYGLQPTEPTTDTFFNARLVVFALGEGRQHFELAAPLPEPDFQALFSHDLKEHLDRFGESLWRITVGVRNLAAAQRYLEEHEVSFTYWQSETSEIWIAPSHSCGATIVLREA